MDFKEKTMYENNNKNNDPLGDKSSSRVNERKQITYINAIKNKEQTQNYIDMNDIVVPILIKKGNDGQIYFALEYTYIPARKQIFIELPSIGFETKKENYHKQDIDNAVTELTNMFQLSQTNGNINSLSSNFDPVSASFTNQTSKFVELGVRNEQGDKRLHWFPVSCLQDILSRDLPMSLQTKYALLLFQQKHKKELKDIKQTTANIDEELLNSTKKYGDKNKDAIIWPHKHRFGVAQEKTPGKIQDLMGIGKIDYTEEDAVYGLSKDSIQCVIARKYNGKIQVGLSSQLRSPFISKKEIDATFLEIVGGGIEAEDSEDTTSENEKCINAAIRETAEETGIKVPSENVIKLSQDLLYSHGTEEMTKFYLAIVPSNYTQNEQKLDDQEVIGKIQWFDLDSLDIDKLHSPIAKKAGLIMAKNYFEKEKERENNSR